MSKLSGSFYGNKKFMSSHYETLKAYQNISDEQIADVFQPYTTTLAQVRSNDGHYTLLTLFSQFIRGNLIKFFNWSFEKLSSWIQISAHVFQHSFEKHLSKKQSFQYFSQVVIRHSLFRPPHSVNIFTYQQAKQILDYWLDTFVRFYEQYAECFQSSLNEIIKTTVGTFETHQRPTSQKKQISREDFAAKFKEKIDVNPVPHKNP